jgi:hypothetical protein
MLHDKRSSEVVVRDSLQNKAFLITSGENRTGYYASVVTIFVASLLTTSSRHVHDKTSQPVDQPASILSATRSRLVHDSLTTDFYSRLVRDKFTTRSNILILS